MKGIILISSLALFVANLTFAQKADLIVKKPLLKYESSSSLNFNSDGWGVSYRYGKAKTFRNKKTWDFSFSFVRDTKQLRSDRNYDNASKTYFYGKQIHFYSLKALRGRQKILAEKPYWGGVEVRWFYFGGLNMGIGKPIYLYLSDNSSGEEVIVLDKYDFNKYSINDIWGRGPYSKGLTELQFYPGLSFKMGLNVEFGPYQEKTKALEAGVVIDGYFAPVQIMSFDTHKYVMLRLYVAYQVGKRYDSTY